MKIRLLSSKESGKNVGILSLITILTVSILFACSSNKNVKPAPEFKIVRTTLAKGINDSGERDILLSPTRSFKTTDNSVIAHVEFANMSGKHKVQWKWYDPDGNLYYKTDNFRIDIPKNKYVEEATAWHYISIRGDKAQNHSGSWYVEIYYDGNLVDTENFSIEETAYDQALNVDKLIPQTAMNNSNGVAVVIGNSNYHHRDIPDVEYAINDAKVMKRYLIEALGYKEGNVIFVLDATKARLEALFGIAGDHRGLLHDYIKPNISEVFIYYSGHGAPDTDKMKGYFVPVDCDPAKVSLNGYSLDLFYKNLSKMEIRKTTVVLDACFSGGTNTGKNIIGSSSPTLMHIDTIPTMPFHAAILTSSDSDQISSWYDEQSHGLFTYFFLQGLGGAADQNENGQITFQEIHDYVSDRSEGVPYWAKRLHGGREQTPMLYGDRNQDVLVQF